MKRKGYKGPPKDDVRAAWTGADAGLQGSNQLLILIFLGVAFWRLAK